MAGSGNSDPRANAYLAARVDDALKMLKTDGMSPALEFMQLVGVPRTVALRVLCSPAQQRSRDRRKSPR
ncbi:hypothetical protein [Massilia litorea]|jgi:hypothetical protein|uniref:Uncharacterized protein n=1 Tax=Massilia litorea TaxID=2769491 RepID=A0A7L9U7H6_9BURK|nr:hypothetical protein [Massilia litorea]QOL50125.1 hypothetical protein LPB04_02005 [Massilia litorea]